MGETKTPCRLFPYEYRDITSLEEAKQKAGWNITAFRLPEAWNFSQGDGVKIAILDSGCDLDHPDLADNLLPGINFVDPNSPPEDNNLHGTHVTGTICAINNDLGVVGVAPKAKVIPVKVLDANGSGDMETVANAIKWAVDQKVDIISMSLGSPRSIPVVEEACQYANSKGIPIFCAAGNAGNTKQVFYPAAYDTTIAIGSVDENFDRSVFSNTGDRLDFMAPGNKILSTVPDNWYGELSGTSMACPFAVGVAALLLSYSRAHNNCLSLNNTQDYIEVLKQQTIPLNNPEFAGKQFFSGFGIINPENLLEWIDRNKKG